MAKPKNVAIAAETHPRPGIAKRPAAASSRGRRGAGRLSASCRWISFKKFNDNHGHDAGDTVLRAVADCLKANFRDEDVACRFAGEEFVVILPGTVAEAAVRKADHVRAKIESLVVHYVDANLPRITISIGVVAFPQSGDNPQVVLKAADEALYRAKDEGRNRVELSATVAPTAEGAVVSMQRPLGVMPRQHMARDYPSDVDAA